MTAVDREFANENAEDATLIPGVIRGFREWRVNSLPGPDMGTLRSLTSHVPWTNGDSPMRAICGQTAEHYGYVWGYMTPLETKDHLRSSHEAPEQTCSCGLYAMHDPMDAWTHTNAFRFGSVLRGVVEAWGRVTLGPRGFRSEFARIAALQLPIIEPIEDPHDLMGLEHSFVAKLVHRQMRTGNPNRVMLDAEADAIWATGVKLAETHATRMLEQVYPEVQKRYSMADFFTTREAMVEAYPRQDISHLITAA